MGKKSMRWTSALILAERISDEPTVEQLDEAYALIGRLARLAHDNARRCERDNDPLYWQGDWRQREHERFTDRWMERAEEINGLFAKYGCEVTWPGVYPTVDEIGTHRVVIFTDVF